MSTPSTEETTLVAPAPDTQTNPSAASTEAVSTEAAVPQVAAKAEGTPFDKMVQDGAVDGAVNGAVARTVAPPEAAPDVLQSDVAEQSAAAPPPAEATSQEFSAQNAASDDDASLSGEQDDDAVQIEALDEDQDEDREAAGNVHVDASLEIDHRRAKQLLDRALLLSERGDFAGAILAARQAVVLTPTSPTGHSMLGLLHERAGDLEKAIASYERVLQLAPQNTLERDSLERLKATLAQENASVIFHFDENELFEDPEALPAPPPRATARAAKAAPPAVSAVAVAASAPPASAAKTSTPASVVSTPTAPARASSGPPVVAPVHSDLPAKRLPVLRALSQQPSFYFKTVPLVATTALGLLFMAWAQGVSQSKHPPELLTPTPTTVGTDVPGDGTTTSVDPPPPASGTSANPTPPPPGTAAGGNVFGQPGAVAKVGRAVVAAPALGKKPASRVARSSASTGSPGTATAPLPPSSTPPIIPQPAVPVGSGSSAGSGAAPSPFAGLPPVTPRNDSAPAVVRPAPVVPAPAVPVAPAAAPGDGGGNSRGGAFFNPGSQPRGVIRVDPVRPAGATAARPANIVRRAESTAAAAAAQGNTGRVIGSMSDSIQRLPTGYAYQRRAMAFLDQGDYSRAADDFQSAIAAYNDQINRNQDAGDARNGLRTSQSGLRMALSNMRRN